MALVLSAQSPGSMEGLDERLNLSIMVLTLILTLLFNPERGQEHAPDSAVTALIFLPTLIKFLILAEVLCFFNVKIIPLITLAHLS